MAHLNIILPITLLLIGFLLKLFIGRNIETPSLIEALCELPVDIIFLALSFSIAFTLSKTENQANGLFFCFAGIAVAILVVALWRITIIYYLKKVKYFWPIILAINLFVSSYAIKKSVDLIIDGVEKIEKLDSEHNK
ncbi:hypothetical protein FF125_11275 [Aureibaculum algae]|uniref:Uncharacterized protein n=1 Tax=Aureibaculum algae TaxID=2584122 RepID=A0A5B7TS07_9FLAO|nr:hypothetical protein [Aureibaculum algae]QCX38988.1 hypothetical protein FF125_11275 [Aureibaculum algae]